MKKSLLAVLSIGALTLISSQAQAYDRYDRDYDHCYSNHHYGYREVVRYERPRYYYYDERPVIIHRRYVDDDCGYAPRYSHYGHRSGIRFFFGF